MNFQPVVPTGGLPGWAFLKSTLDQQTTTFNKSPQIVRDTEYFETNIANVTSAADLVGDRRLLRVALGAFGLQDDLNNRALIKGIIEQGTENEGSLANRLSDERYKQLANAFRFEDPTAPSTKSEGFGQKITAMFRRRQFEVAVGDSDQSMRLAMNATRELADIANEDVADSTKWFRVLGTPPLRKVFETALGLPGQFSQIDIDRQLEIFEERSARQLDVNSFKDLADSRVLENLVEKYLLREQISNTAIRSSAAIALTLLQSS